MKKRQIKRNYWCKDTRLARRFGAMLRKAGASSLQFGEAFSLEKLFAELRIIPHAISKQETVR